MIFVLDIYFILFINLKYIPKEIFQVSEFRRNNRKNERGGVKYFELCKNQKQTPL